MYFPTQLSEQVQLFKIMMSGNKIDISLSINRSKFNQLKALNIWLSVLLIVKYFLVFWPKKKNERNTMLHLRKAIKERSVSNVLLLIQEYWNFLKLYLLSVQFVLSHLLHTLVHNKKPLNVTIIVPNDVCCGIFVVSFLMRHYCFHVWASICSCIINECRSTLFVICELSTNLTKWKKCVRNMKKYIQVSNESQWIFNIVS